MILVTGGTGKIGSELVNSLGKGKTAFTVLARSREAAAKLEGRGAKVVLGDLDKPASLNDALAEVETLFLLTTPRPDLPAVEQKLLAAAKAKGVRKVVRISAVGANPWASSALLRCHGDCEAQLARSGLEWTVLRPTVFMQNLSFFFGPVIARESTLYAPAGEARLPWIDARDIADVAAQVLTTEGHGNLIYELTGPEALTYEQVADLLSGHLGRRISYVNVPDGAARQAMIGAGMQPWLAEGMITLYHLFRANGTTALALDTVERIAGHAPRTLADFLRENEAAFRPLKTVEVLRN